MADDEVVGEAVGDGDGEQPAEVEIDGELVTGTIPVSAARTGWYRSPGGHIAHADGPDQRRAFGDRGWSEITEDEAKEAIADGLDLRVDPTDAKGTFDEDAVNAAVRDEAPQQRRRRRTP